MEKSEEEQSFTIGDGKMYGIYYNAPLSQDQDYEIFIGTGSKAGGVSVVERIARDVLCRWEGQDVNTNYNVCYSDQSSSPYVKQ